VTSAPAPAAASGSAITITLGVGRKTTRGTAKSVRLEDLPGVLKAHSGREAWVIAAEFEGGKRTKAAWRRSWALVVDVDHKDKAVPTDDERRALSEAARVAGSTLWHETPHGMRLWFVLQQACEDASLFRAAAARQCDRVDALVKETRFAADRGASCNCAQPMWAPNALVNDQQRQAEVLVGGDRLDIGSLLHEDKSELDQALGLTVHAQGKKASRPYSHLPDAVKAYRRAHPIDAELGLLGKDSVEVSATGLTCPICGHHGCLSRNLKDAPDQAFCFSDQHLKDGDGCGLQMAGGFLFDIVDIHAREAGLKRQEFLRREGWWDPSSGIEAWRPGGNSAASDLRRGQHLKLVTAADLAVKPRRPDLWARMMQVGCLAVWYGIPKCGKSYIALGLGIAIAEGKPFLGKDTIVDWVAEGSGGANGHVPVARKGMVVYVCGEGVGGVTDKIAATIGQDRVRNADDPFHSHFKILASMPNLVRSADVNSVLGEIDDLGVRVDLIIIDTVARALGAAALDENSTEDMGRFVAQLDVLRAQTDAAVLGIHHAGKSGVDRGSSALRGAADMFARVERVKPGISRFVVEDMRDGEPADPLDVPFERVVVGFDAHGPVERWVVAAAADGRFAAVDADPMDQGEREMLTLIRERSAGGKPTKRADLEKALRISKAEANRRLKRLKERQAVRQVGHGRDVRYVESPPTQKVESESEAKAISFDSPRLGGLQAPSQSRSGGAENASSDSDGGRMLESKSELVNPSVPSPKCTLSASDEAWVREILTGL